MQKCNDEIDAKRKLAYVNERVLARGDVDFYQEKTGKVVVRKREQYLLPLLCSMGVLDHYHVHYGLGFLELQHSFLSPLRCKPNAMLIEQLFGDVTGGKAVEMYHSVAKRLTVRQIAVIQHSCTHVVGTPCSVAFKQQEYEDTFEHLVAVMDDVRKDVEEQERKNAERVLQSLTR